MNEQEFVYSLQEESAMKDIAVSETVKKRIERNQKRVHELDMLIRKIYEDNVIGRLPDRLFQSMLTDYENEQNELNKISIVYSFTPFSLPVIIHRRTTVSTVNLSG